MTGQSETGWSGKAHREAGLVSQVTRVTSAEWSVSSHAGTCVFLLELLPGCASLGPSPPCLVMFIIRGHKSKDKGNLCPSFLRK